MFFVSLLVVSIIVGNVKTQSCHTPNEEEGHCISIFSCDPLFSMLKRNMSRNDIAFLKNSSCGFSGETPQVCCPTKPVTKLEPVLCNMTVTPPAASSNCCGESFEYRIISGNTTFIDMYPWMALIEYKKGNETNLKCGGVLISSKYVLTAAHCVAEDDIGNPSSVRLGEYDTSHDGVDCEEFEKGGINCNDAQVSIPVERIIMHDQYDAETRTNNIALLKLVDLAPFTDFIRPICLPTSSPLTTRPQQHNLHISGWASRDDTTTKIFKKQHNMISLVDVEQCKTALNNTKLVKGQLCAGDRDSNTCRSDYGGPLMWHVKGMYKTTYQVIGILSFGPQSCHADISTVFTDIFEYRDWIFNQAMD